MSVEAVILSIAVGIMVYIATSRQNAYVFHEISRSFSEMSGTVQTQTPQKIKRDAKRFSLAVATVCAVGFYQIFVFLGVVIGILSLGGILIVLGLMFKQTGSPN